jgi:hypothetical protein
MRTKLQRFLNQAPRSSFKKLIVSTPLLLKGLHTMSLLKSVSEGFKPHECKRTKLREPPPVPYVPTKDEVQEEVARLRLGCIFLQESSGFLFFPLLWRFFYRNHNSCSAVTFSECHQETCLYGAYVESNKGYQFVRQKQSTIQFYGTLQWLLSTTIAAPPPPLLCHHCCAATTTATPIAAPPLPLLLLRRLSHRCAAIAVAAPPKPSLHRHCGCCAAVAVAVLPSPLLCHHLFCHRCTHCCTTIAALP